MTPEPAPFIGFLRSGIERGGFETEDVLAAILPLLRDVQALHEAGQVAPLRGLGAIRLDDDRTLRLGDGAGQPPERNDSAIRALLTPLNQAIEVIGEARRETDLDTFAQAVTNLDVGESATTVTRPVYLPGYVTWEHALGHHDALTDVLSLGLLLASVACGLDFSDAEDIRLFADSRGNLFALAGRLHPVVAGLIGEMTELHRGKRAQDLPSLIRRLETYRDQPVDTDLAGLPGLATGTKRDQRTIIQTHLRDRLFELSRRNRLLYFRNTQSTLNLTVASVPLVLDYRNIKPEQLLYWHDALERELTGGQPLPLNRWLRMDDAPYLPGQLDKLISEARRDRAEFGFSQLRLVLAFLRWHNLKEAPEERIHTPLLMLPVELAKRKGVKDHYTLEPTATEAEVNPVLRHHLKQLYDLDLPESVDLRHTSVDQFHASLCAQIRASEPGVTLAIVRKPRIQLIHERAKQRVDQYRRRMARGARTIRAAAVDYSYDRADFRPLGLRLFQTKVLPAPLPLRELAGAPPRPRQMRMSDPAATVTERKAFALVEEGMGNPYGWEFDLCALTLANFNYRKMTLVRDYRQLIEGDLTSAAFDRVFSLEPKAVAPPEPPPLPPAEQHLIIAADATQLGAIARARSGDSFIIQGPPGTGKSQTITNLIADFAAGGKRVLFVCEKRAAIDVVFHRLRQQGLDELCCLIHDSQTDKKEFILNLKQTYEQWLAAPAATGPGDTKRARALAVLETELAALEKFRSQLAAVPAEAGIPVADLLLRLIELRGAPGGTPAPALSASQLETLPHYREWLQAGECVRRLTDVLREIGADPVFARHPLRWLTAAVIQAEAPLEHLEGRLEDLDRRVGDLEDALRVTGLGTGPDDTLDGIGGLLEAAVELLPLARKGLLGLLDTRSDTAAAFASLHAEYVRRDRALLEARKNTVHWRDKLPPGETAAALAEAGRLTGPLAVFQPAWWRLRKVLQRCYDFGRHAVKPTWTAVLTELAAEHQAAAALEAVRGRCADEFLGQDPAALQQQVARLAAAPLSSPAGALRTHPADADEAGRTIATLAGLAADFSRLRADLAAILSDPDPHPLASLAAAIRDLREELEVLPELLPALRELAAAPPRLSRALRSLPLDAGQFELACAAKTLEDIYRADRSLHRFDGRVLRQKLDRVATAHRQWLEQNADWIRAQARGRFLTHVQTANQSATVLGPDQRLFKKTYTAGRRELEHEFGKTMRFKSIRDLAAGDSGQVVRDLKPIWLMSPLSVSDTLPLDPGSFDVVIFDEASQIPVEEAVPAAYRAQQVIVVGDEMQLPPTSFFSASGGEDDELTLDDDGERISVIMDADSFLAQSARNLPSTLLAWHYRSRYEALISFSNAAFYGGELYTIPDRQLIARGTGELRLTRPEEAAALVPSVLERPIRFIHCEQMPYENRRNSGEAAVIAELVRGLLTGGTRLSLGIAAFSEAQQGEIEAALDSLAARDSAFATLLEAEYVREEDDQFCGLFVKNLENIQGDERDIILMSVCYGRDPNGRILMNFGPINQRGGEKRLNVIFSRARHHMVIVSSLRHTDITNDYNDGARALKDFLHYAESLSQGDVVRARQVLDGLNPLRRRSLAPARDTGAMIDQLAEALRSRGWTVEPQVGQSRFRCDLAVREPGAPRHQLAILLEPPAGGVLERFHTQPAILSQFGWQVLIVLAKDWWHEPQAVIDRIERILRHEPETPAETGEAEVSESPEPEPPQTPAEPPAPPVPQLATGLRRFEFVDGGSRKFWEIAERGSEVVVSFGRIGTHGQTQVKVYPTADRAAREAAKLIAEKLRKGYRETTGPSA